MKKNKWKTNRINWKDEDKMKRNIINKKEGN